MGSDPDYAPQQEYLKKKETLNFQHLLLTIKLHLKPLLNF